MKSTTRNIFFAFGLIAVIVMLFTFKVSFAQLWADICHAGYWLFAIFGLWIFLYIMNACTWRIIIKGSGDCPIPFWKILKLTITGFALNYATPAGLMGGEPYKIMELKPYIGTQRATSARPLRTSPFRCRHDSRSSLHALLLWRWHIPFHPRL